MNPENELKILMDNAIVSGDCRLWRGTSNGVYPMLGQLYVHRLVYEVAHGPIPGGWVVMHTCDTPMCINPDHLEVGTYKDNTQDMYAKGRGITRDTSPNTKLTSEDVIDIRRKYFSNTNISQRDLAKEYGVSQRAIWNALHK